MHSSAPSAASPWTARRCATRCSWAPSVRTISSTSKPRSPGPTGECRRSALGGADHDPRGRADVAFRHLGRTGWPARQSVGNPRRAVLGPRQQPLGARRRPVPAPEAPRAPGGRWHRAGRIRRLAIAVAQPRDRPGAPRRSPRGRARTSADATAGDEAVARSEAAAARVEAEAERDEAAAAFPPARVTFVPSRPLRLPPSCGWRCSWNGATANASRTAIIPIA